MQDSPDFISPIQNPPPSTPSNYNKLKVYYFIPCRLETGHRSTAQVSHAEQVDVDAKSLFLDGYCGNVRVLLLMQPF